MFCGTTKPQRLMSVMYELDLDRGKPILVVGQITRLGTSGNGLVLLIRGEHENYPRVRGNNNYVRHRKFYKMKLKHQCCFYWAQHFFIKQYVPNIKDIYFIQFSIYRFQTKNMCVKNSGNDCMCALIPNIT